MAKKQHLFQYESKHEPLLSHWDFIQRFGKNLLLAAILVLESLGVGMCGYHFLESMSWLDSFVNASMILSGMGPAATLATPGGKLFAGCYALYSGLALVMISGLLIAPVVHRAFHRFHLEADDSQ